MATIKLFKRDGDTNVEDRTIRLTSYLFDISVLGATLKSTSTSREQDIKKSLSVERQTDGRKVGGISNIYHLPLPSTINDSTSTSWDNTGLTAIAQGFAEKGVNTIGDKGGEVGQFVQKSANKITNLMQKGGAAFGKALNPNSYLAFKGHEPRHISLTFIFSPQTFEEAKTIQEGLISLKRDMSPNKDSVLLLGAPNIFSLKFGKDNSFLNSMISFELCVLTDMKINYGSDGNMAMYIDTDNGSLHPKQSTVTLSFAEYTSKSVSEWDAKLKNVGGK